MSSLSRPERSRPQILFIDAFDSFTNNIVCLLSQVLNVAVTVIHMNEPIDNFEDLLSAYHAVVVGPGPGHPANPKDVGFIGKLWTLSDEHMVPVLGICLGFQSLCHSQGAQVKKLTRARHGIVSKVSHEGGDIFGGVENLTATQYHSLRVDIGDEEGATVFYEPSRACPELLPLAWDVDDEINGSILMGVRHARKPFWGVQFHPESICTSDAGRGLVKNWWGKASEWSQLRLRKQTERPSRSTLKASETSNKAPTSNDKGRQERSHRNGHSHSLPESLRPFVSREPVLLHWDSVDAPAVTSTDLVEALGRTGQEIVLLDSQRHRSGQHSIVGLVVPGTTMKATYRVSEKTLQLGTDGEAGTAIPVESIDDVWPILQQVLDLHEPLSGKSTKGGVVNGTLADGSAGLPQESPFWGGFVGYISYEAGLETINVEPHTTCASDGVPDINFAFIHRSVVFNHESSQVHVQSLLNEDDAWFENTKMLVQNLNNHTSSPQDLRREANGKRQKTGYLDTTAPKDLEESAALSDALFKADIRRPKENVYRKKVLRCQDFLASGDSYELCLTDETQIQIPRTEEGKGVNEWALYKRLRQNNPAPFGAYLNLSGVTVIGSSPERFLRWTREGRCQFRPIKGTVKKGPDMTREKAHEILGSSKERAENLMIVDLIRHDLSGVVGPESTWVPKLMVVEEYETVYQLVSVIEGQLPPQGPEQPRGLDVLMRSLPPGSMTGAPKKRSCEILRDIEQRPRGVYSGVLGYMDVGGAGDFSVVIRTAMRNTNTKDTMSADIATNGNGHHESNNEGSDHEIWRVGAGGAVTIQSTDEGEFQEMEAKQSSVLGSLLRQKK